MVTRRGAFGGRFAILVTGLVGSLSIATGIANISTATSLAVLSKYIPTTVSLAAGYSGSITGFLLLVGALGLVRRLRIAWYATILLFPVTAIQGLVQSSPLSLPLVALSLVSLPTVFINRDHFDRSLAITPIQTAAIVSIMGTLLYGTVGAYALRGDFEGVSSLTDALYFTLVTASTVGYGDLTPLSPLARIFGMTVIILGTASFATAIGAVLGPAVEARLTKSLGRMTETRFDLLEDHVLLLGYGDLTEPLLEELGDHTLVIVTKNQNIAAELRARDCNVQQGDPSNEEVLQSVGVEQARAVVAATNQDGEDALAILTANQLNPDLRIVGAATDRENVEKLRRAGADTVISPQAIGAHLLVQSALGDRGVEALADRILGEAPSSPENRSAESDEPGS